MLLVGDPAIDYLYGYSQIYSDSYIPPGMPENNASHWDPSHLPKQIMDPYGGANNLRSFGLLLPALRDLGWTLVSVAVVPRHVLIRNSPEKIGPSQPIFITNNQALNSEISLRIIGPHAAEFIADGVPGTINLVPQQTYTVKITSTSRTVGYKTATFRAEYNDGAVHMNDVRLSMFVISGDTDGDNIADENETEPFDPLVADSTGENGQLTPDGVDDGYNDFDGDGMTNMEEFVFGYDPFDPNSFGVRTATDSDGDGISDYDETRDLFGMGNPFDPYIGDSTGNHPFEDVPDGIPDGKNDYDGDGCSNAMELRFGLNPLDHYDNCESIPSLSPLGIVIVTLFILWLGCSRLCRRMLCAPGTK